MSEEIVLETPVEPAPFNPTPEQAEAVDNIINWFRDPNPQFYTLKGYAGTGTTYLMTYLARTGLLARSE